MARYPSAAKVRVWIERWGSPEAAADEAENHPLMRSVHVWGAELSYWERVAVVVDEILAETRVAAPPPEAEGAQQEAEGDELDLGGNGYTMEELRVANDLLKYEGRLVARRLEHASGMSLRRALRFWHWFEAGAVCWDKERGLNPGPGFRWAKRSEGRFTLVRSGSR
jgi:hypothetical protein